MISPSASVSLMFCTDSVMISITPLGGIWSNSICNISVLCTGLSDCLEPFLRRCQRQGGSKAFEGKMGQAQARRGQLHQLFAACENAYGTNSKRAKNFIVICASTGHFKPRVLR